MNKKSEISLKTKKILAGIGIVFGTIAVFLVSFALSFSLIVNPINLFSFDDTDAIKENEELKEKVQTLTDEVELLNVSIDKYKANQSAPEIVVTPAPQSEQAAPQQNQEKPNTELDQSTSANPDEADDSFSPETITGTDAETPEDIEEPITIIDISE